MDKRIMYNLIAHKHLQCAAQLAETFKRLNILKHINE